MTQQSIRYKTITSNWDALDTENALNVSFPCLFTANVHHSLFGELLEGPITSLMSSDTTNCQGVITHYGQYSKLLKSLYALKLSRKSNIDDNETSLGGGKDKN